MGRGGRAGREFIDGHEVKTQRKPHRSRPMQREEARPRHIDLRIVRHASMASGIDEVPEWHQFLSSVGKENRYIGRAYALGSVAITHVTSKQINEELSQSTNRKIRKAFFSEKDKPRMFRDIKDQVSAFLQDKYAQHAHDKVDQMQASARPENIGGVLSEVDTEEMDAHPFGAMYFRTPKIGVASRRRFALDLSLDHEDILTTESREIGEFVGRKVLGLGMPLRRYAPFHATIFETHEHIPSSQTLNLGDESMPGDMFFDKPTVETYYGEAK